MPIYQNDPIELYDDLKQLYHTSAERYGKRPLFMQKRNGKFEPIGYDRYRSDVDALGTALLSHGLAGKRLLILGENCCEWVTAYMATVCGVGVAVPIDSELSAAEIAELAVRTEAAAIFYSAKSAEKLAGLPSSLLRIAFGELSAWITQGQERIRGGDRSFLDAEIDPNAMCVLLFTSGSTGKSKGVMLSHRNLCANLFSLSKAISVDQHDVFLSVLPLYHIYECTCGFLYPLLCGATVAFCEGVRHITRNMQEVHPTVMLTVPVLLETIYERLWANIARQGLEKKLRHAIQITNLIPSSKTRLAAKKRIFAEIHQIFGGRLRLFISGGASVDAELLSGLRDLGFQSLRGYGLTECAPVVTLNRSGAANDRSEGRPLPETLLDICDLHDDVGEVRFRGDNVMLGYYNEPERTAAVLRDGWFYTGDLGYMDEGGFLYLVGRKENLIETAEGRSVFPEEIEAMLAKTAFVKESVVLGKPVTDSKEIEIVAILHPDFPALKKHYGKDLMITQIDLEMKRAVSEVNSRLPRHKHIASYRLRMEEFPKNTSRKIRRSEVSVD